MFYRVRWGLQLENSNVVSENVVYVCYSVNGKKINATFPNQLILAAMCMEEHLNAD